MEGATARATGQLGPNGEYGADPVLPSQTRHQKTTGETRLLTGILAQAYDDLNHVRWEHVREELTAFFFGAYEGPYSMTYICEHLEYDVPRMREAAAALSLAGPVSLFELDGISRVRKIATPGQR